MNGCGVVDLVLPTWFGFYQYGQGTPISGLTKR